MYNYKHEYYTWTNDEGIESDYTVITSPKQTDIIEIMDNKGNDVSLLTEVFEYGQKFGEHIVRSDQNHEEYIHEYFCKHQIY